MVTNIIDPRPEVPDSPLWQRLLTLMSQACCSYTPYAVLHEPLLTIRQGGTTLKRLDNGAYGLRPQIGRGCWENATAYKAKATELLQPHHEQLVELLQAFTIRVNAELEHIRKHGTQEEIIATHLEIVGFCGIESKVLDGEIIYFARDKHSADQVPKAAAVYTLDELRVLVDKPLENEVFKKLHGAKKIFSGTVLNGEREAKAV